VPGQLDNGMRVVKEGLTASDRVIVNGLMRARPGVKIAAEEAGAPAAPAASSARKGPDQAKAD
jgi:membrane fusion protein, multidrug efflux system